MVMGHSFNEHFKNLEEVLGRFKNANLKNPKKCSLIQKVEFLACVVSEEGIQTDEREINSIRDWPVPRDKHELTLRK